jgi:hypothetical protein
MSFKIEYLHGRSNNWTATGTYSSEQSAIFYAKAVAKRSGVTRVRVSDSSGAVVWMV